MSNDDSFHPNTRLTTDSHVHKNMQSRRTVLAMAGATATGVLAGCLGALGSEENDIRVDRVLVSNVIETPADVTVELLRDGKSVLNESVTVPASEGNRSGERELFVEADQGHGQYEGHARAQLEGTTVESDIDLHTLNYHITEPCLDIHLIIDPGPRTPEPRIGVAPLSITDCE